MTFSASGQQYHAFQRPFCYSRVSDIVSSRETKMDSIMVDSFIVVPQETTQRDAVAPLYDFCIPDVAAPYPKRRPYKCAYCDYTAETIPRMKTHLNKHRRGLEYSCKYCHYVSTRRDFIVTHEKIHLPKRVYSCTRCRYSTERRIDLIDHMQLHVGQFPPLKRRKL